MDGTSVNDAFWVLHARATPTPETCRAAFHHDRTTAVLSGLIVLGLVVSYCPQFYRIIHNKSSEGFSPFFLLLGATSSACSLLNILSLQWGQVGCCKFLSSSECFESVLGIAQVFFQWLCFNLIFVLYLIFYPLADKYVRSLPLEVSSIPTPTARLSALLPPFLRPRANSASSSSTVSSFDPRNVLLPGQVRNSSITLSPSYRLALSLFALTLLHLLLSAGTTFILLLTLPGAPKDGSPPAGSTGREHPSERAVRVWATTLGVVSVVLGCAQYAPQILLTLQRKLVGSLSIPMMCLQVPGSFVFVYTLAVRPGVNWTGWGTYLVTGILQGALLLLCLAWKARQRKLLIDDWGRPVNGALEGQDHERTRLVR